MDSTARKQVPSVTFNTFRRAHRATILVLIETAGQDPSRRKMAPQQTLEDRVNTTCMTFLRIELDLAQTYCDLAGQTTSEGTCQRRITNAQTAFDTVERYVHLVRMTNRETESFLEKLADVRSMLEALKRSLGPATVPVA